MEPIDAVFVYGTLQPGEINEHVLKDRRGHWQRAYVHGELIAKGWGAAFGFPGLKLNGAGQKIYGMLFRSAEIQQVLVTLDNLEGPDYTRTATDVFLDDTTRIRAFIYELTD